MVFVDYEAKVNVQAFVDAYWGEEYVQYIPKDAIVKQKKVTRNERKEKEKTSYKKVAEKCCDSRELTPVEEFPDLFPEVHDGLIRYNMHHHCQHNEVPNEIYRISIRIHIRKHWRIILI